VASCDCQVGPRSKHGNRGSARAMLGERNPCFGRSRVDIDVRHPVRIVVPGWIVTQACELTDIASAIDNIAAASSAKRSAEPYNCFRK
jgi:hypothetical protein